MTTKHRFTPRRFIFLCLTGFFLAANIHAQEASQTDQSESSSSQEETLSQETAVSQDTPLAQDEQSGAVFTNTDPGMFLDVPGSSQETVQSAQTTEPAPTPAIIPKSPYRGQKRSFFYLSYYLGASYTFSPCLGMYESMTDYANIDPEFALIDIVSAKGHFLRLTNEWEFRKSLFSFTVFANATLSYLPFYIMKAIPVSFGGVFGAAVACFRAAGDLFNMSNPWAILNVCLLGLPSLVCVLAGAVCIVAIPVAVALFAIPMLDIGGSIDIHPYTNDRFDTKISLGIDLDGIRFFSNKGILGLYAQGSGRFYVKKFCFDAALGYRVDVRNAALTKQSKESGTNDVWYVPDPYVKVGVSYQLR